MVKFSAGNFATVLRAKRGAHSLKEVLNVLNGKIDSEIFMHIQDTESVFITLINVLYNLIFRESTCVDQRN